MKTRFWLFLGLFLLPLVVLAQSPNLKQDVDQMISKMTLEEKALFVVGMGMRFPGAPPANAPSAGQTGDRVPGSAGSTYAIPNLGIPSVVMADGPAGVRISPKRGNDTTNTYYATAFPIATALASTWDVALVEKVGEAIGNQALEYGVDFMLMPGLNIHRNPLCGRNFEYYSEDPLVAGSMAAAMIRGIQANGVGATPKHYAANNQETNRLTIDVVVSERALREIYLKAFEIAVKQGNPWSIMSSYPRVNGAYASENADLLTKILRDDWGFGGFVMTDWFGGKDPVAQMRAGNDLLMPGTRELTRKILDAVKSGELSETVLDANVKRILNAILQTPAARKYTYSNKPDLTAHAALARSAAAQGMVLLKNDGHVLPLAKVRGIALFGDASYELVVGGTGSGDVNEAYSVSLEAGLADVGYEIFEPVKNAYLTYIKEQKVKRPEKANPFFPPPPIPPMPVPVDGLKQSSMDADIAIITIGRLSGEFQDRKLEDDFNLSPIETQLIGEVSKAFHVPGKKVVVVLNIGGPIETASWRDKVDAVLLAWQPGQEGGNSIADVLKGEVHPSGRLPMTFPMAYEDVSSAKNFPGPLGDRVVYEEGIYVGYRYANTFKVKPAYEFGFGLSYTEFTYGPIALSASQFDNQITATVRITNTGYQAGREVVQLYLSAPQAKLDKPESELRAFAKTKLLKSGQSETVTFTLGSQDLASFDTARTAWVAEEGTYTVKIGSSSASIKRTASFTLAGELVVEKVTKALSPSVEIKELTPKTN